MVESVERTRSTPPPETRTTNSSARALPEASADEVDADADAVLVGVGAADADASGSAVSEAVGLSEGVGVSEGESLPGAATGVASSAASPDAIRGSIGPTKDSGGSSSQRSSSPSGAGLGSTSPGASSAATSGSTATLAPCSAVKPSDQVTLTTLTPGTAWTPTGASGQPVAPLAISPEELGLGEAERVGDADEDDVGDGDVVAAGGSDSIVSSSALAEGLGASESEVMSVVGEAEGSEGSSALEGGGSSARRIRPPRSSNGGADDGSGAGGSSSDDEGEDETSTDSCMHSGGRFATAVSPEALAPGWATATRALRDDNRRAPAHNVRAHRVVRDGRILETIRRRVPRMALKVRFLNQAIHGLLLGRDLRQR